jgi:parallel beta-helix repeat protein
LGILLPKLIFGSKASTSMTYNWGRYSVIENKVFNNPSETNYVKYDSVIYRNCIFQNRDGAHTDANVIGLRDVGKALFENCTFKNLRKTESSSDYHAINIWTNVDSFIVRNCTFENISADGIQIGHMFYTDTVNNFMNYMLIEGCKFINPPNTSTENGIDIKAGCMDKGFIQNNYFEGFRFCDQTMGCSGGAGALAIHYRYSKNLTVRNNTFRNSSIGVSVSIGYAGGNILYEAPPANIKILNNVVQSTGAGIHLYDVVNAEVSNNIVYNSKEGIYIRDINSIKLNNNTVVNCWEYSIREYNASEGSCQYNNNLIVGNVGKWTMYMTGASNIKVSDTSEVKFCDPLNHDYRITSRSTVVIDKGADIDLKVDIEGESRPKGLGFDIGADEYSPPKMGGTDSVEVNSKPIVEDQSFDINESDYTKSVGTIIATDEDNGQTLSYTIISGNESGLFTLNSSTGILEFTSLSVDFTGDPTYILEVEINDNGSPELSSIAQITVNLFVDQSNSVPVIADQSFSIYEEDNLKSLIGQVKATDPDPGQELTYFLINGNEDLMFTLDNTSGNLYLSDPEIDFITTPPRVLTIEVRDNGYGQLTDQASVTINFIPDGTIYYIDPDNESDLVQNGSIDHPYSSYKDIHWESEAVYLQKRNTIAIVDFTLDIKFSDIRIGAYGNGEDPVIKYTSTPYLIRSIDNSDIVIENLKLEAKNALASIYFIGSNSKEIKIRNCQITGSEYGIRIIDGTSVYISNSTISNTEDGLYILSDYAEVKYCNFVENDHAINFSNYIGNAKIFNNDFVKNKISIVSSNTTTDIYNNIFYFDHNNDIAINHSKRNILSENNIFYPEHPGMIIIDGISALSLQDHRDNTGLDMNSFCKDPKFRNISLGDLSIKAESPAIDAGMELGILSDMYGTDVPFGSATDIGSCESNLFGSPLYSGDIEKSILDVELYPNPTDGIINLKVSEGLMIDQILITDITGKVIHKETAFDKFDNIIEMDISMQLAGFYYFSILITNGERIMKKVLLK